MKKRHCEGTLRVYEDGDFKFKAKDKRVCDKLFSKINPVRGTLWKKHSVEKFKDE